jgi:secondary thiamine-phosphate synthase enzyme
VIQHYQVSLPAFARGYHLITDLVVKAVAEWPQQGLLHVFIKHTSAALCINENADPTVRTDFEKVFNMLVPENLPFLDHDYEGPDDMPAHIKAAMIGTSVTIPIVNSKVDLGIWQGIFLCEFRNRGGSRKLVITLYS